MVKEIIFSWQFLAVFSTIVWAIVNIVDKHVVSERIRDTRIPTLFTQLASIIVAAVLLVFFKISIPETPLLLLLVFGGMLWILAILFYYKALQAEEVSRVVPIFMLDPIFTAILAAFFLEEIFGAAIYSGIFLVVAGAIIISFKKGEKFYFGKGFWLILASTIIIAVEGIIIKFALNQQADFLSVYFWARIGTILAAVPMFFSHRKNFFRTIKNNQKLSALIMSIDIASAAIGLVFTLAISLGPVTLVSTIAATHSLFVLFFAVLLTKIRPDIISEETGKTSIAVKLAAILMMIFGAYLVAV